MQQRPLREPNRRVDKVVVGEPQRAFYGNQFNLTFPIFDHLGVQLWVPEVGGPILTCLSNGS
jgi:site-specific DNA recombinase